MKKYSLFGFLTYVFEFFFFCALCIIKNFFTREEIIAYVTLYCLGNLYLISSMIRAKRSTLKFRITMKSPLMIPKFMTGRLLLCNVIAFLAHIAFDLTILGDIIACTIIGFVLLGKNLSARILTIFFTDANAYKVEMDETEIIVVIKNKIIKYSVIDTEDILELSHIAGDYYLLTNLIKKDQQNDDIEENKEKELLEA